MILKQNEQLLEGSGDNEWVMVGQGERWKRTERELEGKVRWLSDLSKLPWDGGL